MSGGKAFCFKARDQKLDLRKISRLDLDKIVADVDVTTLQVLFHLSGLVRVFVIQAYMTASYTRCIWKTSLSVNWKKVICAKLPTGPL